jgi:adenylate cyclase
MARRALAVSLIALASVGLLQAVRQIEVIEKLELMTYDWRARAAPVPAFPDIVVVAIDERSLRELAQWPWPRSWHARLIKVLKQAGARLIAFDIVLAGPSGGGGGADVPLEQWGESNSPEDTALAKAIRGSGRVVLAATFSEEQTSGEGGLSADVSAPEFPYHAFADAALGVGPANIPRDPDNVVRRYDVTRTHQDKEYPTLAVVVAARAQGLSPEQMVRHLRSQAAPAGFADEILLRFSPPEPSAGGFAQYSYCDVLKGAVPADALRNKIVFVGGTAQILQDLWHTPVLSTTRGAGGEQTVQLLPGVVIQATAVGCLLQGHRIVAASAPLAWTVRILCALWVAASLIFLRPLPALAAGVLPATVGVLLYGARQFAGPGVWTPVAVPVLGAWVAYSGGVVYRQMVEETARRRMRRAWQRRVSPEVLNLILSGSGAGHIAVREIYATVLFSDLRGYTTLSATHPPQEVVAVLNRYLTRMTSVITGAGGTINKFMGDGIMAVFGDPVPQSDHALRAVRAALEMQRELDVLRAEADDELTQGLFMRVGIHSGTMLAGDIGSEQMLEYTVIGDTVNTASRLESLGKEFGTKILISADTYELVRDHVTASFLGSVEVRNRPDPIGVYDLTGLVDDAPALA